MPDRVKNVKEIKIIFLHHSTGQRIWNGEQTFLDRIREKIIKKSPVQKWFSDFDKNHYTHYSINDRLFPKKSPYGWKNYPYDYYNIWVKHAGDTSFMEEPTLEMLTKTYNVIIWKHCFPVGDIEKDTGQPNINSERKSLENYKLQYLALKDKMHTFPDTKFIIWTGAAYLETQTTLEKAKRTKEFFTWVKEKWDEPGDNIYLWDFYQWETSGGVYMNKELASGEEDSHPNKKFSGNVFPYFCNRIIDVIEHNGTNTSLTGETIK